MFAWKDAAFGRTADQTQPMPRLDTQTTGMIAGTKVATNMGWRKVEAICEGDQVLTFDGGLQTVIAVTRHFLMTDMSKPDTWPLNVPVGVLGNRSEMQILPAQAIMIESDTAEECLGDPFALIPGAAMDGFRGITQSRPAEWVEVIELHFARDEIVFANIGALFLCRAKGDLLSDVVGDDYDVLPMEQAETLVRFLDLEANGQRPTCPGKEAQFYAAA